ncbi:MAG: hypothetical protein J7M25_10330 [Deltaproteobacteria bacterium]|nr:hypothetical protein [Deltaproteobacteria bacterium]
MVWLRRSVLLIVVAGAVLQVQACRRLKIHDDFRSPYEAEDLVPPASSRFYSVSAPTGVMVDIAVDYDQAPSATPPVQLMVRSGHRRPRLADKVAGGAMKRAVCGVSIGAASSIDVQVQNLKLTRSVPFSIRIERSPSPICQPYNTVPSMVLVRNESAPVPLP